MSGRPSVPALLLASLVAAAPAGGRPVAAGQTADALFEACTPASREWAYDDLVCLYRVGAEQRRMEEARERLRRLGGGSLAHPWVTLVLGHATLNDDEAAAIGQYETAAAGFGRTGEAEGEVIARQNLRLLFRRRGDVAVRLAGIALTLGVLELCSRTGALPRRWFPPVSEMYVELGRLLAGQPLWVEIGRTLRGWGLGIALAALVAVPAGMALGSSALAYRAVRPVVEFLRPVPSVALIPLAVLVYGVGVETKVFLVTFASFWPILLQTIYGVQDVDPVARDTARSYGLGALAIFREITLPSAAPYIATGLRIASAIALILAVTAELVVGVPGLGQAIVVAQSGGAVTRMYALIIVTGLLGWGLNSAFRAVEARLLRWHPSHRREEGL